MHNFGKSYQHDEFYHRFNIFKQNLDKIDAHNAKKLSWTKGINQFTDLTGAEFKRYYTGGFRPAQGARNEVALQGEAPASIDWSTKGATTAVKDQGQCGSCWSFSTTGALEGLYFKDIGNMNAIEPGGKNAPWTSQGFSEQYLVDCSGSAGNQGCDGGLMDYAFTYVGQNGIPLENNYHYTAQDGTCKTTGIGKLYFKGLTYTDVPSGDENSLLNAVANQPVSIAIEADQECFQSYSGGVLTPDSCDCGNQLDHGVLAVGYGTDSSAGPYWKIKNSWAASWGDNGFVRIARGSDMCGIADAASYPAGKP